MGEIDRLHYLKALLRWWGVIVGAVAVNAVAVVIVLWSAICQQAARALVVISRERIASSLNLDLHALLIDKGVLQRSGSLWLPGRRGNAALPESAVSCLTGKRSAYIVRMA